MPEAIGSLLSLLPGLANAAKGIAQAQDEAKRNAQLIEFQGFVIQMNATVAEIQIENAALRRDKDDLQGEIDRMRAWGAEKERYVLSPILQSGVAYCLKKSKSDGEAPHWLCPNCFTQSRKSFLTPYEGTRTAHGHPNGVACATCSTKISYAFGNLPSVDYAEEAHKG